MTEAALLDIEGLRKSFGTREALRGVDLSLQRGESVALFGPNGAGKTTLLRILASLARPSAGAIRFLGHALDDWGTEARRHIALVSHKTFLQQELTAEENLRFYGRLYGSSPLAERVQSALLRVEMLPYRQSPVRALSRGMQQRVSLARLLLHDPLLLLLDEPYTGLDPHAMVLLESLIAEWTRQGKTLLLTSHDLERGARHASRILILRGGKLVYDASRAEWPGPAAYERYTGEAGR